MTDFIIYKNTCVYNALDDLCMFYSGTFDILYMSIYKLLLHMYNCVGNKPRLDFCCMYIYSYMAIH